MSMNRGYGLLPSAPSNEDVAPDHIVGSTPQVPEEYLELLPLVQIADQSLTNSCVWQAIAQGVHILLKAKDPANEIWLSTLFGYYNTLQKRGNIVDLGCAPREALDVLTTMGFCSESAWPFDPNKVLKHPLPDSYTEANDQKTITHYFRLFGTGDDLVTQVKQSLSLGYPVIYGSPIDAAYEANRGELVQTPSTPWLGSHMRCLVGYTEEYAIEANSWGTGWGNNGLGHISWDFIKWPYAFDFWVFDSAPLPSS